MKSGDTEALGGGRWVLGTEALRHVKQMSL